jgi:hypothetical protein
MNNLLSYHGLVDARISASEKDLPVKHHFCLFYYSKLNATQNIYKNYKNFKQPLLEGLS